MHTDSMQIFDNIKDFLQTINIYFDVITISETWLDVWKISDYEFSGYQAFHTIRSHKKGGGVAIICKIYLIAQSLIVNRCVLKTILSVLQWNLICPK